MIDWNHGQFVTGTRGAGRGPVAVGERLRLRIQGPNRARLGHGPSANRSTKQVKAKRGCLLVSSPSLHVKSFSFLSLAPPPRSLSVHCVLVRIRINLDSLRQPVPPSQLTPALCNSQLNRLASRRQHTLQPNPTHSTLQIQNAFLYVYGDWIAPGRCFGG